jgi:hypothetical protein
MQLLRLYSLAGRQLSIMSLQGAPVALAAAGALWVLDEWEKMGLGGTCDMR